MSAKTPCPQHPDAELVDGRYCLKCGHDVLAPRVERREEYALLRPDGQIIHCVGPEFLNGSPAREHMQWMRDQNPRHNLTVVHRTVTFTEWEEVQ